MIYDQADIVARRLLGQKVGERVYYESADNSDAIRRFLHSQGRVVVTAPRQSGKTTELLLFAEGKYPLGQFIVVCLNQQMQESIILKHREIFQAGNMAKRLNGQKIDSLEVNPPLILTSGNIKFMRGQGKSLFVDEFNLLSEGVQKEILDSGLFEADVSS